MAPMRDARIVEAPHDLRPISVSSKPERDASGSPEGCKKAAGRLKSAECDDTPIYKCVRSKCHSLPSVTRMSPGPLYL